MLTVQTLPYSENSSTLAQSLLHLPYFIFLDSNFPHHPAGRFDILAANPSMMINTQGTRTVIETAKSSRISDRPIFELLKEIITPYGSEPIPETLRDLPFTVGWLGYAGYDIGRTLEHLDNRIAADIELPNAFFGFYPAVIVVDHVEKQAFEIRLNDAPSLFQQRKQNALPTFELEKPFRHNISRAAYEAGFEKIQQHLQKGDCYQVNYAQRFSTRFHGHAFGAYLKLRTVSPTPFAAFIQHPKGAVLSLSPERLMQVQNGIALTQPIKGTRKRGETVAADDTLIQELQNNEKERAENIMIVDLLRNDFGRCCVPGSVEVSALCELQTFSNVHHLVSTITGVLRDDQTALDLLQACFPGGSVTGVPKVRVMEIIESVEAQRRSVYCGSIGFCDIRGFLDMNIAIRTMVTSGREIHCYGGGGIVLDSTAESEYQESLIKVSRLLNALEC